jgi:DeoR/GlpR family transcriptional regulator of sugar metabolism
MLTQERKAHILKVLGRDGRVVAKELSQKLGLSEDTIRRDLRELAGEGLLQRVHGGALPASPAVADFTERQKLASNAKTQLGRVAAQIIQPGQVVFLDGGTTAVQLARSLPRDLKAMIVTHSPSIAVELVEHPNVTVEVIGGRLFKHSIVAVGATAMESIARVRADIYFMGVTGVHPDIGLTTGDAEEAAVKRMLAKHAAETIVLASREKLGAASPYVIAPLSEIDTLLIESGLPEDLTAPYRRLGITLIEA